MSRSMKWWLSPLAFLIAALILSTSTSATAQTEGNEARWRDEWRTVSLAEHFAGAGLFLASVMTWLLVGNVDEPLWRGSGPLDTPIRDLLRADTYSGRSTAALISDILWHSTYGHALAVDAVAVAWGVHGDSQLAFQLASIDGLSIAATTLVVMLSQGLFLRERPYGAECELDGTYDIHCEGRERFRSFISGHSAVAAAAASLTCVHHAYIPLYGNAIADAAACGVAGAFAFTSGLLRIVADQHYLSDVIAGWAVGTLMGILLPIALHYES